MIFEPHVQASNPLPPELGLPYERITIPVGSGEHLIGWWFPPANDDQPQKTLLLLHGTGGLTEFNFQAIALWHQAGYGALAFNYRGFGQSSPSFPHETQIYQDALAAYDFLTQTKGIAPENLVLHGHSLGGAVAIELANRCPVQGLFLENTFTSMLAVAMSNPLYRLFPVKWLLQERFDSAAKIAKLQRPIFICYGDLDGTVPKGMGKKLWAIAKDPKKFVSVPDADHINLAAVAPTVLQQGITWLESFPSTDENF